LPEHSHLCDRIKRKWPGTDPGPFLRQLFLVSLSQLYVTVSPYVAAAILVQTLVDHHPQLQAEIRQDQPDPKPLAQALVPYYKAILDEMKSQSA
jgi:hypothetical protein